MTDQRIISADSHFVEPPEMWRVRIDSAFWERAPHLVTDVDGQKGQFLVCEDLTPSSGGGFLAAGVDPEDVPRVLALGYEVAPEHIRDPAARIKAQDADGVAAEVMYASYGMRLFHIEDTGLRNACFRAFNDWAADYCSHDLSRLHGIGLIGLEDIDSAVTELARIAAKGLKGAMIWAEPPEDRPYSHADYQEVCRSMTDLIINGVLDRHPGVTFVSAENEIAWLPFHLWRMDQLHEKLHAMSPVKLSMKPSDYFRRQFFATFIEDPLFPASLPYLGSTNIMWSSDFPHLASTWPHSHQFIDDNLGGVGEADLRNIVHDNAARLYGITGA